MNQWIRSLGTFLPVCALLLVGAVSQAQSSGVEASPNRAEVLNPNPEVAPFDLQFSFDLFVASGANGNAGAEFDGTSYYTTRWASNLIHEYDMTGALVREFSIPGVTGLRDLAFDGTYFYGGNAGFTIYQMDFATETLVTSIASPVAVRHISYDDGADGFWVGNWADAPRLVDRGGATLNTLGTAFTSQYGSAYDGYSPGGPYLWIFDQGTGAGTPQTINQVDLATGTTTGVFYDVEPDFGLSGIAGGLFVAEGIVPGTASIGGVYQAVPDMFVVYELTPVKGGGDPLAQYGVCYGSIGHNDTTYAGYLITIDPMTGAGTPVGLTGILGDFDDAVPELAISTGGVIYAPNAAASSDLYTIDASTGAATLVGTTGLFYPDAWAFDDNDVLYAMDSNGDLYTVDPGTAVATLVGTGSFVTSMAFDPDTRVMYAGGGGGDDNIYTVDLVTGGTTLIGATGLGGSTPALHFDQDGNLYGTKGGGMAANDLISIDKTTGAGTVIGPIGMTAVAGLGTRLDFPKIDPDLFWDDFDSYTAGMQLVSQNGTDWDTWSNTPGSGEDPFVSDLYAYSGSNSVVVVQNNDLIRRHGDRTTGTWGMSFQMYIPAGQAGYFNTMSDFDIGQYWAMECYFDAGGTARLLTGLPQLDFTWTEDTWHLIEVVVDLDADSAQFLFDGEILQGWQWTLGASGGTGPLQLSVNDFFGASALDEMYFDDYHFAADMIRSDIGPEAQMSLTHTPGSLNMGIFNDGSIGADQVGFLGPGITWNGVQGCFVGGPMFGTSAVGAVNGLIGSFSVFGDLVNVASNFAGGFTSDGDFDQIAWADLDDSGAAVPYGVDILQRSYSNTGEEVGFIRYGYVNSSGDNLSEFYAGIFLDWDVASDFASNSGGVDTDRNMIYNNGTIGGDPYFGLVALDGNLGGRTTTATPAGTVQQGSFDWISTLSTVVDPNGDFRTWIGTGPMDILAGDTAWVTFAVVAGDDLAGIQANADGAAAKAKAVGWIVSTGVNDDVAEIPVEFDLAQNYPNPFNPTTTIQYSLKEQASVVLTVYDILGKEVRTLINEEQAAGVRQVVWDGKNNTGAQVASGMYIYRIQANDFVSTMKMLLMK